MHLSAHHATTSTYNPTCTPITPKLLKHYCLERHRSHAFLRFLQVTHLLGKPLMRVFAQPRGLSQVEPGWGLNIVAPPELSIGDVRYHAHSRPYMHTLDPIHIVVSTPVINKVESSIDLGNHYR